MRDVNEARPRSAKAKDAMLKRREKDDLRAILALPAGRRFLMRVLEETKIDMLAYTGEPFSTAHNEGMRSVGIFIRDIFKEADFCNYILALTERNQEEQDGRGHHDDADHDDVDD